MDSLTRVHLYTHPSEACDRIEQLEIELRDARRELTQLAKDLNAANETAALDAQEFPRVIRELRLCLYGPLGVNGGHE